MILIINTLDDIQSIRILEEKLKASNDDLHMKNGQMRHVMRYKKKTDFGVIYHGDGDKEYLNRWAERVAINFASRSLGAYSIDETEDIANAFGNY